MAHTKSGGSTRLGRDSFSKRLGIKVNESEAVKVGEVIVRQRGSHVLPGNNVAQAGDDTLYAMKNGTVKYVDVKKTRFDGTRRYTKKVHVVAAPAKK